MRKKQQKDRKITAFVSDELEGIVLIIGIASGFLAAWGLWVAIEAITEQRSLSEFVAGLGTFIFFFIAARQAAKRL